MVFSRVFLSFLLLVAVEATVPTNGVTSVKTIHRKGARGPKSQRSKNAAAAAALQKEVSLLEDASKVVDSNGSVKRAKKGATVKAAKKPSPHSKKSKRTKGEEAFAQETATEKKCKKKYDDKWPKTEESCKNVASSVKKDYDSKVEEIGKLRDLDDAKCAENHATETDKTNEAVLESKISAAGEWCKKNQASNKMVIIIVAVVGLGAIGGAGWYMMNQGPPPEA